jgi:hypothetical protein
VNFEISKSGSSVGRYENEDAFEFAKIEALTELKPGAWSW